MKLRIALVLAPIFALLANYAYISAQLPDQLPMQWNAQGEVNWEAPPGFALGFVVGFMLIMSAILVGAGRARSARLADGNLGVKVMLEFAAVLNLIFMLSFQLMLECANATPIRLGLTPGRFVAVAFGGTAIAIIYVCVRVWRADKAAGPVAPRTELEKLWQDPKHWEYRVYYCKQDPRLVVPKRGIQIGGTFNFAHPAAIPVTALLILVPLLAAFGGLFAALF